MCIGISYADCGKFTIPVHAAGVINVSVFYPFIYLSEPLSLPLLELYAAANLLLLCFV